MTLVRKHWHKGALLLIMAIAGFLSFYAIGREGYGNLYYAAAVKSMLNNWHSFFYASFDSAGYVTVDKPALGLWLQALSAFIFGFQGWSVILPEALSAVISVALTYHLVQRFAGKAAGLLSALILALTPILIAVSRTNNLDSSLIMVLLLAVWAMIVAAERGSLKLLLLSVVLVGLGFNIKMLQSYMVLPAFYLVYFFTAPQKIGKRIIQLTAATLVLLVVSFSWAVVVDLTPANQRPYIGSSKTNSVVELALGYNGLQRLLGRGANILGADSQRQFSGGINQGRSSNQNGSSPSRPSDGSVRENSGFLRDGNFSELNQPFSDGSVPGGFNGVPGNQMPGGFNGMPGSQGTQGNNNRTSGRQNLPGGGFGGPGGSGENGAQGILRIFNQQQAGQISWLLPMAFFGIFLLGLRLKNNDEEDKTAVLRQLLLWTGWIVPMLGFFSVAAFYHRYYLSMLAPGIAALAGIGIVEMFKAYQSGGKRWVMLPAALVLTALIQAKILWVYPQWRSVLVPVGCGLAVLSAAVLIIFKSLKTGNHANSILSKLAKTTLAAGIAGLLLAPAIWAATPMLYGSQTTLPVAGPELNRGGEQSGQNRSFDGGFGINSSGRGAGSSQLVEFLLSKKQDEKYLLAVADANSAAPIIIQTGEAVMAVGGFSGSDNILTVERLSQMVKDGEIRFFQISGRGMGSEISRWVQEHGKVVTFDANNSSGPGNAQQGVRIGMEGTLYDLAPEKG